MRTRHTVRIAVDGQAVLGRSGQVFEGGIAFSLLDHKMDNDQSLEAYGPGRVAKTLFQRAEDLGNSGLAARCSQQDVFDIFGLGRRKLQSSRVAISKHERWVGAVA